MSTQRISLNTFIDPAQTVIHIDADARARFDLASMPRIEGNLLGRPAESIPELTTHLCGICPVAHHIAGMRALDAIFGLAVPPRAQAIRRLLTLGAELVQMAPRFVFTHAPVARALRAAGLRIQSLAGCPGHFPHVAIPGGTREVEISVEDCSEALELIATARRELNTVGLEDSPVPHSEYVFPGVQLRLTTEDGSPDFVGDTVQIVDSSGAVLSSFPTALWPDYVHESVPGDAAPRPRVRVGDQWLMYRVGPSAQAGRESTQSPLLAVLMWTLDEIEKALAHPDALVDGEFCDPLASRLEVRNSVGVGIVDGPRGLLTHRYTVDSSGTMIDAQILTPTAQNEPWLAHMLTAAWRDTQADEATFTTRAESLIRLADPCVPAVLTPPGGMTVHINRA